MHAHAATEPTQLAAAPDAKPAAPSADIVDTAVGAGSFKTLVAAVQAAGLVDTLKSAGPFTVFAPTDEAFAKLPAGTVEALLKDKAKLTAILTYHVVPGKVLSGDVVKLKSAKTVQGQSVTIDASKGVMIDKAQVVKADIECSNGVIHVIDTVLLPKE
ncbi:MAG: Nex18 symbiotically induced protein [Pirellula sp.]|nr:Nex18 symbiotically induced protein [Pirellula sp.]